MDRIKKHEDLKNLVHPVNPVKNSSGSFVARNLNSLN